MYEKGGGTGEGAGGVEGGWVGGGGESGPHCTLEKDHDPFNVSASLSWV